MFAAIRRAHRDAAGVAPNLLVFGSLARAPSQERRRCLLTQFGLAQFTAGLSQRLVNEWCRAFNIFDALPPHTVAAGYPRPIHTT
jgi:hypothetical protein